MNDQTKCCDCELSGPGVVCFDGTAKCPVEPEKRGDHCGLFRPRPQLQLRSREMNCGKCGHIAINTNPSTTLSMGLFQPPEPDGSFGWVPRPVYSCDECVWAKGEGPGDGR